MAKTEDDVSDLKERMESIDQRITSTTIYVKGCMSSGTMALFRRRMYEPTFAKWMGIPGVWEAWGREEKEGEMFLLFGEVFRSQFRECQEVIRLEGEGEMGVEEAQSLRGSAKLLPVYEIDGIT